MGTPGVPPVAGLKLTSETDPTGWFFSSSKKIFCKRQTSTEINKNGVSLESISTIKY